MCCWSIALLCYKEMLRLKTRYLDRPLTQMHKLYAEMPV